jgi:thioredoxin-dependent peroxiredoxin
MAAKKTVQKPAKPTPATAPAKKSAAKPAKKSAPAPAVKKSAPAPVAKKSAPAAITKKSAPAAITKKSAPAAIAKKSAPAPAAKKSVAQPPREEASSGSDAASSLVEKVKRAASKVAQVAASAALKVLEPDTGRKAPSFELSDQAGKVVSSASLAGKPYLLYFYPKDDTPGCTKEACDIRDNFARFGKLGLRVVGVSPDSTQSHAKFIAKYGLPFTLLSDPDKTLATAYGVWAEKSNYGKKYMGIVRSTFLVGADGLVKRAYRGVKVNGHVDALLEDAKAAL